MLPVESPLLPRSSDVRAEAIRTLVRELGITKAAFFIRENLSSTVDYLAIKEDLFGGKTAAQVVEEIKAHRP